MKSCSVALGLLTCSVLAARLLPAAEPASLRIQADRIVGQVTPYTLGACIEDVNHEIYGGLYSQMVFGESFQEPAPTAVPPGFAAFGGSWNVNDEGELAAAAGPGPKLLAVDPADFESGKVQVEVRFADKTPGNAGLIVRVQDPGVGADKFTGYEISLYPETGRVILGRHRQNWEPLVDVPCPVPLDRWIPLAVKLDGKSIVVSVDGTERINFTEAEHPLPAGQIGLRTWQRAARFRHLQIESGGKTNSVPLRSAENGNQVSGMWRRSTGPIGRAAPDSHFAPTSRLSALNTSGSNRRGSTSRASKTRGSTARECTSWAASHTRESFGPARPNPSRCGWRSNVPQAITSMP